MNGVVRTMLAASKPSAGSAVRKGEALAVGFRGDAVGFRIRGVRKQERPLLPTVALRHAAVVELIDPPRQRVAVVLARHEPAVRRVPVDVAPRAADRQDRRAILHRDGQHARLRVRAAQPVGERGAGEAPGRRTRAVPPGEQRRGRVGDPDAVHHDPGRPRKPAGEQGGVPGRGLGDGVVVVRVREDGPAADQAGDAAGELGSEPVQVVAPELVDRHEHHERRLLRCGLRVRRAREPGQGED